MSVSQELFFCLPLEDVYQLHRGKLPGPQRSRAHGTADLMDTQRLRKLSGLALGFYCCSVAEARHLDSKFTALSTESNCCAYGSGRKSRMTTLSLMEAEESSSIFNPEWRSKNTESRCDEDILLGGKLRRGYIFHEVNQRGFYEAIL
ncbi:uncharacterized protein LOC144376327 isoform X5 [Ictidomys tridecemlineatus]